MNYFYVNHFLCDGDSPAGWLGGGLGLRCLMIWLVEELEPKRNAGVLNVTILVQLVPNHREVTYAKKNAGFARDTLSRHC